MRTRRALVLSLTVFLVSCAGLADLSLAFEPSGEGADTAAPATTAADRDAPPGAADDGHPAPARRVAIDSLYARLPRPADEDPGQLLEAERREVLAEVNRIRALHRLAPVDYDSSYDDEVTAAALIIAANAVMTHHPDASMVGYSDAGAAGARTSNIHISFSTDATAEPSIGHVRNWLIDDGVLSLGHRRWILDPFLPAVAYGRVDGRPAVAGRWAYVGGAALKVIFDREVKLDAATAPEFVAYPFGDYPVEYASPGWYWSFAVVADPSDRWANRSVRFDSATVAVRAGGGELTVRDLRANNEGFGLPNSLQWRVEGARVGERYAVAVRDVEVNGESRSYEYDVRIVE